jgi:hypothetical protein
MIATTFLEMYGVLCDYTREFVLIFLCRVKSLVNLFSAPPSASENKNQWLRLACCQGSSGLVHVSTGQLVLSAHQARVQG